MQRQQVAPEPTGAGFPELNELGRQLEVLRIQRGVSKQHLARFAGTSRQQLWRVMTGKSELTSSLRDRLAQALGVAPGELGGASADVSTGREDGPWRPEVGDSRVPLRIPVTQSVVAAAMRPPNDGSPALADYLADPGHLVRTLASLPTGTDGVRLKRHLLNSFEDLALERSLSLPAAFFEARRKVLAGEL